MELSSCGARRHLEAARGEFNALASVQGIWVAPSFPIGFDAKSYRSLQLYVGTTWSLRSGSGPSATTKSSMISAGIVGVSDEFGNPVVYHAYTEALDTSLRPYHGVFFSLLGLPNIVAGDAVLVRMDSVDLAPGSTPHDVRPGWSIELHNLVSGEVATNRIGDPFQRGRGNLTGQRGWQKTAQYAQWRIGVPDNAASAHIPPRFGRAYCDRAMCRTFDGKLLLGTKGTIDDQLRQSASGPVVATCSVAADGLLEFHGRQLNLANRPADLTEG